MLFYWEENQWYAWRFFWR